MLAIRTSARVTKNRYGDVVAQARRESARRNKKLAELNVEVSKPLTPRSDNNDPGHVHLVDTLRAEADSRTGAAFAIAGDESRGVDYAGPVHEGTHLTQGNPFLREGAKVVARRARSRGVRLERG